MCGLSPAGAYQRRKVDLLLSLAASAVTARERRCPPSPALARAADRSIRPLCGKVACLLPCMTRCVVAAVRRVRGGGGENRFYRPEATPLLEDIGGEDGEITTDDNNGVDVGDLGVKKRTISHENGELTTDLV